MIDPFIHVGEHRVCRATGSVDGGECLAPRELQLLCLLFDAGRTVSRSELLDAFGVGPRSRVVDMTMRRLRSRLEDDPAEPRQLLTEYRKGYRFHDPYATSQAGELPLLEGFDGQLVEHTRTQRVWWTAPVGTGVTTRLERLAPHLDGVKVFDRPTTLALGAVGGRALVVSGAPAPAGWTTVEAPLLSIRQAHALFGDKTRARPGFDTMIERCGGRPGLLALMASWENLLTPEELLRRCREGTLYRRGQSAWMDASVEAARALDWLDQVAALAFHHAPVRHDLEPKVLEALWGRGWVEMTDDGRVALDVLARQIVLGALSATARQRAGEAHTAHVASGVPSQDFKRAELDDAAEAWNRGPKTAALARVVLHALDRAGKRSMMRVFCAEALELRLPAELRCVLAMEQAFAGRGYGDPALARRSLALPGLAEAPVARIRLEGIVLRERVVVRPDDIEVAVAEHLDGARTLDDVAARVWAYHQVASVYTGLHRHPDALLMSEEALRLVAVCADKALKARVLARMGAIYLNLRRYSSAVRTLREAEDLARSLGFTRILPSIQNGLGQALSIKDPMAAMAVLEDAEWQSVRDGTTASAGMAALGVAWVAIGEGETGRARVALRRAARAIETAGLTFQLPELHLAHGVLALFRGDAEEAAHELDRAALMLGDRSDQRLPVFRWLLAPESPMPADLDASTRAFLESPLGGEVNEGPVHPITQKIVRRLLAR